MEVVVTTGAIRRAKLQSKHHHQQTNIQLFTGRMPFLLPNQQRQSTEENYVLLIIQLQQDAVKIHSPGGRQQQILDISGATKGGGWRVLKHPPA